MALGWRPWREAPRTQAEPALWIIHALALSSQYDFSSIQSEIDIVMRMAQEVSSAFILSQTRVEYVSSPGTENGA
jgi:hypothetical protein